MPIYVYHCLDCEQDFDKLRPMGRADDPIACKHCDGASTQRSKVTLFMALTRSSSTGESSGVAGTQCGCNGSCGGCGRHCGRRA